MPEDYSNTPFRIFAETLDVIEKAGPMNLSELVSNGKLTFDPSLKILTNWKCENQQYFIGQVNKKGQPHGICRMMLKYGGQIKEGQFFNGQRLGFSRRILPNGYCEGEWQGDKLLDK